jgi:hypothetical protein
MTFEPYPTNPPNPFLTSHLLQNTYTSAEYQELLASYGYRSYWTNTVWDRMPRYTLARCPFCEASYSEPLDTHSLRYWWINGNESRAVFATDTYNLPLCHPEWGCPHLMALQTHLNLNGVVPVEKESFHSTMSGEPCVMAEWLTDSIPAIAVIHSLPICRLEDDQFVPRYLLYTVAYYSMDAPSYGGASVAGRRPALIRKTTVMIYAI